MMCLFNGLTVIQLSPEFFSTGFCKQSIAEMHIVQYLLLSETFSAECLANAPAKINQVSTYSGAEKRGVSETLRSWRWQIVATQTGIDHLQMLQWSLSTTTQHRQAVSTGLFQHVFTKLFFILNTFFLNIKHFLLPSP